MQSTTMAEQLLDFVRQNGALVEVTLFALGFAESLVIVSFFVPASVLFLAIAALHAAADGAFLPILLAGATGAFLGDIVSYVLGKRYTNEITGLPVFKPHAGLLDRAKVFINRYGTGGIAAAKFIGPMRPLVPMVCGLTAMPWRPFLFASAASSVIWSIVFLAPSFYGWQLLDR